MTKVITGTSAADNITVQESGVTVNAGAGDDTVHLKKGTGNTVNGQAGHDTVYVYTGTHTVYGGAGDDTMVTWGNAGDGSRFEGGTGDDSFKIKGGNNHVIITGDGSLNTINLDKGSGHSITGGNTGVDRLFICSDDVTNITANLQNGENRATLWGGSDNTITGGDDTDIFNLKGGKKKQAVWRSREGLPDYPYGGTEQHIWGRWR